MDFFSEQQTEIKQISYFVYSIFY